MSYTYKQTVGTGNAPLYGMNKNTQPRKYAITNRSLRTQTVTDACTAKRETRSNAGTAPRETERALNALIDTWINERGCSRLIAAGYAADAAKREYDAISYRTGYRKENEV